MSWGALLVVMVVGGAVGALAANGIYVNNQKIDQLETDRIKLLSPTDVTRGGLVTKANFSSPLQYYQYLVGGDPGSYLPLLWGKNQSHFPSVFRLPVTTTTTAATPINLADDLSSVQNTLEGTIPVRPPKRPHRPKPKKPARWPPRVTPQLLALLRRHFSFNCSLTPRNPVVATTATPTTTTTTTTTTTVHPSTRQPATIKPVQRKRPPTTTTQYVEPPVIKRIGGVLETVYSLVEDALTSSELVSDEGRDGRRSGGKVKRESVPVTTVATATTAAKGFPADRNKLTTNIHVTSEYTAVTPPGVPPRGGHGGHKGDSSEEESDEGEDDGDYYGGFAAYDDDYEEDEDDDEGEDDDDDDDDGDSEGEESPQGASSSVDAVATDKDYEDYGSANRHRKRKRKQRPTSSYEEYSDEADEDDDGEEPEADGPGGGFLSGIFSSIGRFVSSLGFGGARGTAADYDDYGDSGRSTTPRIVDVRKRPTRSTDKQILPPEVTVEPPPAGSGDWFEPMTVWDFFSPWSDDGEPEATKPPEAASWLPSFFADPSPSPDVPLPPLPSEAPPVTSGWLPSIFTDPAPPVTEKPPPGATGWLASLFAPEVPPTTTVAPPIPAAWLSAIAQQLQTTTRQPRATTTTTTAPPRPKVKVTYAGHQLWRLHPRTDDHVRQLLDLQRSPAGAKLQWWKGPSRRGPNDVLVPPEMRPFVGDFLRDASIERTVTMRDIGNAIRHENPPVTRREQAETESRNGHPLTWFRYHRYADITKFLAYIRRRHPGQVELVPIGRSHEGRPLTVARVSLRPRPHRNRNRKRPRPAVFVEAGAHGREWIGPAVATWLLDALLSRVATANASTVNGTEAETLRSVDWYVLPVLNPDGYEYAHQYDRLWRKSRSRPDEEPAAAIGGFLSSAWDWLQTGPKPPEVATAGGCIGTDLDRNWEHRWGEGGASRYTCSERYAGGAPLDEPETRALAHFLSDGGRNVQIYVALHAYGQLLRYPADERPPPPDVRSDVHEMAAVAVETLHGTGPAATRYTVQRDDGDGDGTSAGYARHRAGIRYAYTLQLPDTGAHGFLLPPSGIEGAARDAFELLKAMVDYI